MKIGIVRHFPVPHNRCKFLNRDSFAKWVDWYDHEAKVKTETDLDITNQWDVCFCSDLGRAQITAQTIFKGKVITERQLREVPFFIFPIKLFFPLMGWKVLSRIGWWANMKSQPEPRVESLKRCEQVLSSLIQQYPNKRILIVTHGFFMQYLKKELSILGFQGTLPIYPKGGNVYSFEKE